LSHKGTISILVLGLFAAAPGFADLVSVPSGMAGALPSGAYVISDPNVTEIQGTIDTTDRVAMFEIDITDPQFFSALTVNVGAHGIPDPELFLFDAGGNGVYASDDITIPTFSTQSCLPSFYAIGDLCGTTSSLGPITPGEYFLAIAIWANNPQDASSNYIFPFLTDPSGPDTSVGPIAMWDDMTSDANTDDARYDIKISDTPEPAAWPLTAALGLGIILFRRKLRTR
jgi:hypothetical protein